MKFFISILLSLFVSVAQAQTYRAIAMNPSVDLLGTVIYTIASTCPAGTIPADGSSLSTTSYASLFSRAGYIHGGAGSNFGIPDLRGIFVSGAGSQTFSSITYSKTLGTKQTDQIQGHVHNYIRTGGTAAGGTGVASPDGAGSLGTTGPVTDGTNGTPRTGTETRPANYALTACVIVTNGPIAMPYSANKNTTDVKTSAYQALVTDEIIQANTTAGAFTVTLPSASESGRGKEISITKVDSGTNLLTVSGNIEGSAYSTVIHAKGDTVVFWSDGSTWLWRSNKYRTEFVTFAGNTIPSGVCSGANTVCSTVFSSGSWYSSITRNATVTGLYDIAVRSGVFPSRGSCQVGIGWGGVQSYGSGSASMYSTTALTMQTFAAGGTATDAIAHVTCTGLR